MKIPFRYVLSVPAVILMGILWFASANLRLVYWPHPETPDESSYGLREAAESVRLVPSDPGEGASTQFVFRRMARAASRLCGIPSDLYERVIGAESAWDPNAVSSQGAYGLAQIMPSTAQGFDPTLDIHEPWQNLLLGACLLRQYHDRFGSWPKALHAYHSGPTRVVEGRVLKSTRAYADGILGR